MEPGSGVIAPRDQLTGAGHGRGTTTEPQSEQTVQQEGT